METDSAQSQCYLLYRTSTGGACVMIEVKHLSGEPVAVADLTCYEATRAFPTDWHKLTIKRGSKLFLTSATAARMVEDGRLGAVPLRELISCDKALDRLKEERWKANAPKRALLRVKLIKAGVLRPIGDLEGPQGDGDRNQISRERITTAGRPDRSGNQADARKAEPEASPRIGE